MSPYVTLAMNVTLGFAVAWLLFGFLGYITTLVRDRKERSVLDLLLGIPEGAKERMEFFKTEKGAQARRSIIFGGINTFVAAWMHSVNR